MCPFLKIYPFLLHAHFFVLGRIKSVLLILDLQGFPETANFYLHYVYLKEKKHLSLLFV